MKVLGVPASKTGCLLKLLIPLGNHILGIKLHNGSRDGGQALDVGKIISLRDVSIISPSTFSWASQSHYCRARSPTLSC